MDTKDTLINSVEVRHPGPKVQQATKMMLIAGSGLRRGEQIGFQMRNFY